MIYKEDPKNKNNKAKVKNWQGKTQEEVEATKRTAIEQGAN